MTVFIVIEKYPSVLNGHLHPEPILVAYTRLSSSLFLSPSLPLILLTAYSCRDCVTLNSVVSFTITTFSPLPASSPLPFPLPLLPSLI